MGQTHTMLVDLYKATGGDVLDQILGRLSWRDFLNVAKTGLSLHRILQGSETWKQSHWEGNRTLDCVFRHRRNVFITGPGGVGKSYTLSRIRHHARVNGLKCVFSSTTACSAALIGGVTVHSLFGTGLYKNLSSFIDSKRGLGASNGTGKVANLLRTIDILVIDEVSMQGERLLEILDFIARRARRSELPFGGMQVIFSGDLYQLPPIQEKRAFLSPVWRGLRLVMHEFCHSVRHAGDLQYHRFLSRMRQGDMIPQDRLLMASREGLVVPDHAIRLYATNVEAAEHNEREYARVEGSETVIRANDVAVVYEKAIPPARRGRWEATGAITTDTLIEELHKQLYRFPTLLRLKRGAQYYITYNINPNEGLINGASCVFEGMGQGARGPVVMVRLNSDPSKLHAIPSVKTTTRHIVDGTTYGLCRSQYPLKLGYAVTIHYSQGATLTCAYMDASKVTSCSQFYVGLSRVPSLECIYLAGASERAFKASPQVKRFYAMASRSHAPFSRPSLRELGCIDARDPRDPNAPAIIPDPVAPTPSPYALPIRSKNIPRAPRKTKNPVRDRSSPPSTRQPLAG